MYYRFKPEKGCTEYEFVVLEQQRRVFESLDRDVPLGADFVCWKDYRQVTQCIVTCSTNKTILIYVIKKALKKIQSVTYVKKNEDLKHVLSWFPACSEESRKFYDYSSHMKKEQNQTGASLFYNTRIEEAKEVI